MDVTEADRFLNCVMRRSESDSLFRIGVVLSVTLLCPVFVIVIYYEWFDVIPKDAEIALGLAWWTIMFYTIYLEVKGMNLHRIRDTEWADALTSYARSRGRGSEDMDRFLESKGMANTDRAMKASKAAFLLMFAFNISLIFLMRLSGIDEVQGDLIVNVIPSLMIVELAVTAAYIFKVVASHDSIQNEFTVLFVEAMGDVLDVHDPMRTSLTGSRVRLWPHVVLLVVTLGMYATVFNLLAVHKMNIHVTTQWSYENRLVAAIAKAEGASRVEKDEAEGPKGVKALIDLIQ
ncbi:MAG: hypothetical protein IKR86_07475 [Candidatus Methanomethylophilaceae archaeon]|nr:hypothetical protein [Candidatus Methanomethylophilaceae archaeon]